MNDFSKRYYLGPRCVNLRKRGGRSAEARLFRRKRAEVGGSVAEGWPKQLAQTLTGRPTKAMSISADQLPEELAERSLSLTP